MRRSAEIERKTLEVEISGSLDLDGSGSATIETGLGFLDHMLNTLAKHAAFDLILRAVGDLEVDDHHTIEDCGLAIGEAIDAALGDRSGITRFGSAYVPLDEALARSVVDLSGRGWAQIDLALHRESIGPVATENLTHFFRSLAAGAQMALHIDLIRGDNDHHKVEAAFKATALALREAVSISLPGSVPSTKGSL